MNLSYQNTFVLSDSVVEYYEAKSTGGRQEFTPEDAQVLLDGDEEAYLLDGELGLFDLTASYRFDRHWSDYVTIPVLFYSDGIFDEFIESFHDQFGFDTQHREVAFRDHDFFHSSGQSDYGVQLSYQRFFTKQAFYLTVSEVFFAGFERSTASSRSMPARAPCRARPRKSSLPTSTS
jgi:hypothetical protein